ncbi:MAG: hypothetical protein INQ03_23210 [Candidatus Heimdallarchaeota archaeon]|nr:hypothetical protein [Candidatus Heimdallarchaeota archaeon]
MRLQILILLLLIQLPPAVASPIDLAFDLEDFQQTLLDDLAAGVVYENGKFKGWPFRDLYTRSVNDEWYNGYSMGQAGIAETLLMYNISDLIDDVFDHFNSSYFEENGGLTWARKPYFRDIGWTGVRYGTAGILPVLLQYADIGYDIDHLIDPAITWLISQQRERGMYAITEGDFVTTGMEYGMTGVGECYLKLFSALENQTYLDLAYEVVNSLFSMGSWNGTQFSVPWSPDLQGSDDAYGALASRGIGEAGIIEYLLHFYELSSNDTILDHAIGLGKELLSREENGSWKASSEGYVSYIYVKNDYLGGYPTGSAGIAPIMLALYDLTSDEQFLASAARIEAYVTSLISPDGGFQPAAQIDNYEFSGMLGISGIIQYFLELYARFGQQRYLDNSHRLLNHLYTRYLDNGMLLWDFKQPDYGISYYLDGGISGVLQVLNYYANVDAGSRDYSSYSNLMSLSSTTEQTSFPVIGIFSVIILIYGKKTLGKR